MTKVLVFESDPSFAGELRTELGRMGCTVQVVDDGNYGLQVAASDRPDLILLSIELPRMNGFSVCNKLKKDVTLKEVPLIIMSSESSEETFEQHRKLRTRAEDYIHKPIAFGELVGHIRNFVPIDSGPVEGDSIVIDEAEVIDDAAIEEEPVAAQPAPSPAPAPVAPAPVLPRPAAAPVAPVKAPVPARPAEPAGDSEIEAFIGGAFNRLLSDEEETTKPSPPAHAPPLTSRPARPDQEASPPPKVEKRASVPPPKPPSVSPPPSAARTPE